LGRTHLTRAPLLDRDRLVARRRQVLDLVAEAAVADHPGEVGRRLLASLQRAVAVAGVRGEQLRAPPGVRAPQVRRLVALAGEPAEQLAGVGRAARVEQRERVRELERRRLGALEDGRIAQRLLEVGRGLDALALAHRPPAP